MYYVKLIMKIVNIVVDDGLHAKFKSKSYADGKTMKRSIVDLIYNYVGESRPKNNN